jgi:hypothetical protein
VGIVAFENGVIPCFTSNVEIAVEDGLCRVEQLRVGDWVSTVEHDFQQICWIGRRHYGAEELAVMPHLYPVRIQAGALGMGLPKRDLLVSRQHRVLVQSKIAQRMFGETEALVAAVNLTKLPGVFVDDTVAFVEYFHLLFRQHELVYAEGAIAESLFIGVESLKALSPAAREEILTIFPEVNQLKHVFEPAKYIPSGKLQKRLIERHVKNDKPVLMNVGPL